MMNIETAEYGRNNVTEAELNEVFDDDRGRGEYMILTSSPGNFIQAAGEYDGPYMLEYKENDQQYKAVTTPNKEDLRKVFLKYLKGDATWRNDFEWELLNLKKPWWKIW